MPVLLYLLAAVLFLLTAWDAFITIFSVSGAGPVTKWWTQWVWRGLLRFHHRRPIHRMLSLAGPAMLLTGIVLWYVAISASVFLLFAAENGSVINERTREPANLWEKFYFVCSTVSSLGYGDYVPPDFPWTLLAGLAAVAATMVLTVSLSYVISVVSASLGRKELAQQIFGLGESVPDLVRRSGFTQGDSSLKNHFLQLSSAITSHAHHQLAYPVLNFFHNARADHSPARAVLLLSDAFFVMQALPPDRRPPGGLNALMESSITSYIDLLLTGIVAPEGNQQDLSHLEKAVQDLGGPAEGEAALREKLEAYRPRRRKLVALCKEDGW